MHKPCVPASIWAHVLLKKGSLFMRSSLAGVQKKFFPVFNPNGHNLKCCRFYLKIVSYSNLKPVFTSELGGSFHCCLQSLPPCLLSIEHNPSKMHNPTTHVRPLTTGGRCCAVKAFAVKSIALVFTISLCSYTNKAFVQGFCCCCCPHHPLPPQPIKYAHIRAHMFLNI